MVSVVAEFSRIFADYIVSIWLAGIRAVFCNVVFSAVSFEAPDHTAIVKNGALVVSGICQRLQ
jgi:hypothetical protein